MRVDGYDWYLVAGGWVAAAGKDGEEWLRPVPRDEGSWILVASQRLPVYASVERAVAGPDGRIYVFGGLESNYPLASPVAAAWSFDLEACTWEELAPMPIPVQHPGVALSADGLIYAVGGWTGHEASSGVVAYDPAIDTWVNKA
ncbi:MAG: kelch repeat-containing protein, partial [Candidatus Limnocylindria bacterium]